MVAALAVLAVAPGIAQPFWGDDSYVLANALAEDQHRNLFAFNIVAPNEYYYPWHWGVHFERRFVRIVPSALIHVQALLFGNRPALYHLITLLLHTLNAVLAWSCLKTWSRAPWRSAFAVCMPAAHPAAAEVVSMLNCQPIALALTFSLGSLLGWSAFRRGSRSALVVAWAFMFLAVTSYEAVILLPLLLVLGDALLSRGANLAPTTWRARLGVLAIIPFAAVISLIARYGTIDPESRNTPTLSRFGRSLFVDLPNYLFKFLVVFNPKLPRSYVAYNILGPAISLGLLCVVIVFIVCLVRGHSRVALVGALAFGTLLAPPFLVRATVSILNVPSFRQLYLPSFGAALLLLAVALGPRAKMRLVGLGVLSLVVAAQSVLLTHFFFERNHTLSAQVSRAIATDSARAIAVIGDIGCGYSPRFDYPERRIVRNVPLTRQQKPPQLTRVDENTIEAFAAEGFLGLPIRPEPFGAGQNSANGEYWSEGMKTDRAPPAMLLTGSQRGEGATVEMLEKGDMGVRRIRVHFDAPLSAYTFIAGAGCEVWRLDGLGS